MDRQVVERVFKEHYSDIYNFIYHYIMDEDDAKDLAQDTFIAFMQAQDTLPPDLNVKQYLLSIAKNRCISFLRHKQVEDRHNLKYFESVVFTAATEYDTTRDELLDRLHLAIDQLTSLQRQIIDLKMAGKTYDEIADDLTLTHTQVHKNVRRAYAKLRDLLQAPPSDALNLGLLYLAIDQLTPLQRQIIDLKMAGKTYDEIADDLTLTHTQVHKNVRRAYAKLRDLLQAPPSDALNLGLLYLAARALLP